MAFQAAIIGTLTLFIFANISPSEETGVECSCSSCLCSIGVMVNGEEGGGIQGDSRRMCAIPESLDK